MKHFKNNNTDHKDLEYKHFSEELMFISTKKETFEKTCQQINDILREHQNNRYEFAKLYLDTNIINKQQLSILPEFLGSTITGILTTFACEFIIEDKTLGGLFLYLFGITIGTVITILLTNYNNAKAQKQYYKRTNNNAVIKILQDFCDDYEKQVIAKNITIKNDAI